MLFDAVVAVLSHEKERQPSLITRHTLSEQRKPGQRVLLAEDNAINQNSQWSFFKKRVTQWMPLRRAFWPSRKCRAIITMPY